MADRQLKSRYSSCGQTVYLLDDHELVRRGLRQLLEPEGFSIVGESGSARVAAREILALGPDLVILDDDLPDGSGAGVCRAVAAVDLSIRCVLLTGEATDSVLIESVLAGGWGCLSKQDGDDEQLRLIRRVLDGRTAYSGMFQPRALSPTPARGPKRPEDKLLALTSQEHRAALGLASGLSNRQISQEMLLAEKTVKNLVSSVLTKLGMERRTQAAVLVTKALGQAETLPCGRGFNRFPERLAEVTAALLECTREEGTTSPTDGGRAAVAARLADALAAARTGVASFHPVQPGTGRPAR